MFNKKKKRIKMLEEQRFELCNVVTTLYEQNVELRRHNENLKEVYDFLRVELQTKESEVKDV